MTRSSVTNEHPVHRQGSRLGMASFTVRRLLRLFIEAEVHDGSRAQITRDLNEDVRDRVRALADTEAFQQSRRERNKVEMRFAHMKRILGVDRFRLRGLSGIRDEVLLTATTQDLRRLARLRCRAPRPLAETCLA